MNLFENNPNANLLPYDGTVIYYGPVIDKAAADQYLQALMQTIAWKNDEAVIFGKRIVTAREVAWYGDEEYRYTYSNTTKKALPWTQELRALKTIVEQLTGTKFNSCLLNLYHSGNEGMAWHSDDESSMGVNTTIASFSFGAVRKFSFKHKKTKETVSLMLEHGSVLVMKGATQTNWLHCLPKTTVVKSPRVNLTFRTFLDEGLDVRG